MATLNGVDLFYLCTVDTVPGQHARQLNAYPGVNGLESLRMGTRGHTSTVKGYLLGASIGDLNAAEISLRTYQANGGAYDFVDNYGNTWSNVYVASVDFSMGRVMACASAGVSGAGYCRPYVAILMHLQ